jgi:hypothetical protein
VSLARVAAVFVPRGIAHAGQQVGWRQAETVRQAPDHVQSGVVLAAFDPADVRPVRLRTFRQFFLRQAVLLPEAPQATAERGPKVVHEAASWTVQVSRNIGDLLYSLRRDREVVNTPILGAQPVDCPVCGGRGTVRGRSGRTPSATQYPCVLCDGTGVMRQARGDSMLQLRQQMQRVADAMQAGHEERAAGEARRAAHLALEILESSRNQA